MLWIYNQYYQYFIKKEIFIAYPLELQHLAMALKSNKKFK